MSGEKHILLIGVGNPFRGDDGIGGYVSGKIKEHDLKHVLCIEHYGEGVDLIEQWKGFSTVIVIDAVSCDKKPGTILRFELPPDELPKNVFACSTHALNIADVIHLAKTLDQCPDKIIIYGVAGTKFETGQGFSDEVQAAASVLIDMLINELQNTTVKK